MRVEYADLRRYSDSPLLDVEIQPGIAFDGLQCTCQKYVVLEPYAMTV